MLIKVFFCILFAGTKYRCPQLILTSTYTLNLTNFSGNGGGTGGLGGYSSSSIHAAGDIGPIRKPTRLEALPGMGVGAGGGLGKSSIKSKKSVPVLNTMGTF